MKNSKLILLAVCVVFTACAPATPSREDLNNQLEKTIASESDLWTELNIDSYQIVVTESSVWVEFSMAISVRDDDVVGFDVTCRDALLKDSNYCIESTSDISPETYTIQGLFEKLKKSRVSFETSDWSEHLTSTWSESLFVSFDTQYHYPKLINFDIPEADDEAYTTEIISFTIQQK